MSEEINFENLNIVIEEEFWNDFIQEAFEHLDEIEMNILTLEKEPENTEIIHSMFRAFHTIKGLSGFVEHFLIQEIAHKTETLMDYCRKGETNVTPDIINSILKSADYIKNLCNDRDAWRDQDFIANITVHVRFLTKLADDIENPNDAENTTQEEVQNDGVVNLGEENRELDEFLNEDFSDIIKEEPQEQEEAEEPFVENEIQLQQTSKPVHMPEIKIAPEEILQPQESLSGDKTKTRPATANEEYMKVANSKIDHLVDIIGELIINQSLIKEYVASKYSNDSQFVKNLDGLSRVTRELQDISMFLRLVSLKPTFQKLTRIARDTIKELGKDVDFVVSGESTEIDRTVADKLLEPLVHIIKNAISHGIESNPDDRTNRDKSQQGRVELNAYNKRSKIYIEVIDDGRGIDTDIVLKKAIEKGFADPNKEYTPEEIREFILMPGFSTAEKVDNISGRGVGMDVVKTQIIKLGGKINIKSKFGEGSTFVLEVPVNHAIMNGIIIDILTERFIIPTVNVSEILQPQEEQWIYINNKRAMINVRDKIIPVVNMSKFFNNLSDDTTFPIVMLLELDQEYRALPITNVINRQEIVVKPPEEEFANLKYLSGMSILGNGQVSLILDVAHMFEA